ncbi:MAG TPA: PKD domain-containing protein [Pseudonocardiaceae bacterium]|nr:PKD domain-containing protein [Pseudonocardiaceae bacterium]
MRLRVLGVGVAGSLAIAMFPAVASAATQDTLFVDHGVACSDTGTGTEAQPFCTIQAAVDQATPGQTVLVDPFGAHGQARDTYTGNLTITASGTTDAPITVTTGAATTTGGTPQVVLDSSPSALPGVRILAHDVVFTGFSLDDEQLDVGNSQRVTLSRLDVTAPTQFDDPGVVVTGSLSSDVTVTGNRITGLNATVAVTGGTAATVTDNLLTTDMTTGTQDDSVLLQQATGTVFTNNTVFNDFSSCGGALRLQSGATGTTVENNVFSSNCSTNTAVTVVDDSVSGTTLDYNVVHAGVNNPVTYFWSGTTYATPAELTAATGQGEHDTDADPRLSGFGVPGDDVTVDSANPDAPGTPDTDVNGTARVDDPVVPNTLGGFVDRGAIETKDPVAVQRVDLSTTQAPVDGTVTMTVVPNSPWSAATGYTIDFGDGTSAQSTSPTFTHAYAAPGTYPLKVTTTDGLGNTSPQVQGASVLIHPQAPTVVRALASPGDALTVNVIPDVTDTWDVTGITCDWGDGSAPTSCAQHDYAEIGTYTITVIVRDAGGNTTTGTTTVTTLGTRYLPLGPKRLLDTRAGTGTNGRIAKVPSGGTLKLKVAGVAGIPVGVQAVALNVTVTDPTSAGNVSAYPDGVAKPATSTVNFSKGQTVPNLTVVPVGADGVVDLTVAGGGSVDLLADATGYFVHSAAADGFTAKTSTRLLDTRAGTGTGGRVAPVAAHGTLPLTVAGAGGIPMTGVTAVALNVTVTSPKQVGFVTAYPDGTARPGTSNVNYVTGQTVANLVIVPVGADGKVDLFNGSTGTLDLVADVTGYFHGQGGDDYVPVTPTRALDTRTIHEPVPPRVINGSGTDIRIAPPQADAVVVNLTVTDTKQTGYALVGQSPLPPDLVLRASTLNWAGAGATIANLAIASTPLSAGEELPTVSIYNGSSGTIDAIVDVLGYYQGPTTG